MYVMDAGQATHFQSVYACAEKAGYIKGVRVDHVGFGVVFHIVVSVSRDGFLSLGLQQP